MTFEKDYNKIVNFCRGYIRDHNVSVDSPEESVSEAYVKFFDSGLPYSYEEFIKLCKVVIFTPTHSFEKTDKKGVSAPRIRWRGDDHKTCKDCKATFPIEMFRTITLKKANYIKIKSPYCRKCQNKRSKKNEKKNRQILSDGFMIRIILGRRKNVWSREFLISRPRLIEIERNILMYKRKKRASCNRKRV